MKKRKSIFSVREATAQAFEFMPERFNAISLTQMAKSIMARPMCMDGTILRRLRELRNDNPSKYNYHVIDSENAIYEKRITC